MKIVEVKGTSDLFSYPSGLRDGIAIPTNGCWKKDGAAVMGKGMTLAAVKKLDGIEFILGSRLKHTGNHAYSLGTFEIRNRFGQIVIRVFSFPTKYNWKDKADLDLIKRSAEELAQLVDKLNLGEIYLPVPGCVNGGLRWSDVRPIIENILDDRFVVIKDSHVKE